MSLPATITTNLLPDFKNSPIGPFPRIVQEAQDTDNSTSEAVGSNSSNVKKAQSFQVSTAGDLASIDLYLARQGTPTDAIIVQLCADNSGDPGTVLATGTSIPATALSTTARYFRSVFFVPPALSTSTTYWIVLSRSGSLDASNFPIWSKNSTAPYANGSLRIFGTSWSAGTGDARFKCNIRTTGRYIVCVDKTNNQIRMFKSSDGQSWSEQDSANAPAILSTSNCKSVSAVAIDNVIAVWMVRTTTGFQIFRYNTTTDAWGSSFTLVGSTNTLNNTSVSGSVPLLSGFTEGMLTDYIAAHQGVTETVMGQPRRRVKVKRKITGSGWNSEPGYDLVGSPNTPDVTTLPGTAVDHDLRAAIMDGNGVFHMWWTESDDSDVHHRSFDMNGGASGTFATANLMGSTAAVTSNSAAYSIGLPANYYRSDEWYISLPYTDSGAIKVSKCKASLAATASNWTNTTVVASGAETTNSNPAVLIADNEQGGRLFLIFTKTDGKLYITHDSGADTWVPEQEIHPGTKTIAGLSAGLLVDLIGVAYLDTSPTPDEIRYDESAVFF